MQGDKGGHIHSRGKKPISLGSATSHDHYLKEELYHLFQTTPHIFEFFESGSLDGVWYWDIEHPEHEWYSPRFWEILGYKEGDFPHKSSSWQQLIHPEDLRIALDNFDKHTADPNHPYDQVVRYRHRNGSTVWVRCRGMMIRNAEGKPIRMLGAHTDVTELKAAEMQLRTANTELEQRITARTKALEDDIAARKTVEQELRALQAKLQHEKDEAEAANNRRRDFLATVSHDLRTPLNIIIGYTDILRDISPTSEQQELLGHVQQNVQQLLALINNVLDLSRIDAGKLELHLSTIPLRAFIDTIVQSFAPLVTGRPVQLRSDIHPQVPDTLVGDKDRLTQILMNLLSNALKFTDTGQVLIRVLPEEHDPQLLRFEVQDTGIGIPPEECQQLFQRFAQAHNHSKHTESSGLGLAICRQLIERMGGRIGVHSVLKQGSTFWFTLPRTLTLVDAVLPSGTS